MTDITNIETLDELSEVFDEHGWKDSEIEEGDKEIVLEVTRELTTTFSIYQDDFNNFRKEKPDANVQGYLFDVVDDLIMDEWWWEEGDYKLRLKTNDEGEEE